MINIAVINIKKIYNKEVATENNKTNFQVEFNRILGISEILIVFVSTSSITC